MIAYGAVTVGMAVVAIALLDSGPAQAGIAVAWVVQLAVVWPLDRALSEKRDATRVWGRGVLMRMAVLGLLGGLVLTDRAVTDLPVAYAAAMLVLLFAEAAWLMKRSRAGLAGGSAGEKDNLDRTQQTG